VCTSSEEWKIALASGPQPASMPMAINGQIDGRARVLDRSRRELCLRVGLIGAPSLDD
jgi:hypothetical protein